MNIFFYISHILSYIDISDLQMSTILSISKHAQFVQRRRIRYLSGRSTDMKCAEAPDFTVSIGKCANEQRAGEWTRAYVPVWQFLIAFNRWWKKERVSTLFRRHVAKKHIWAILLGSRAKMGISWLHQDRRGWLIQENC